MQSFGQTSVVREATNMNLFNNISKIDIVLTEDKTDMAR